jgi:benzil reductase ((S)-benzoin forming)
MANSIVWISGATQGLGAGLADLAAESGARVINFDRAPSNRHETIAFDLTDPNSWEDIANHFRDIFAIGSIEKATLLVVGHANIGQGLLSKVNLETYQRSLVANGVAPIMLGSLFLRNLPEDVAGGLMLMSSGSAARPVIGQSSYSACKCAIEGWVGVMKQEIAREGRGQWVVAVRPGFVDTPSNRELANEDPELYPRAAKMGSIIEKYAISNTLGAKRIWDALPPPDEARIISFDGRPQDGPEIIT